MTARELRGGVLNQQLSGMESRDQRGPDKKEQWLILRAVDRVNATLPEIHQAQGKERTKLQTLLEQTDPTGCGLRVR